MDNFDLKKYLAEGKLHKQTLKEFVGGDLENRNEILYKKLVPDSGKSDTVEGEMLRAINRIIYRYYNDGDYYHTGYGTETAGPAHSYLINSENPLAGKLNSIFDGYSINKDYERMIVKAFELILGYIEQQESTGNLQPNDEDMFEYESEFMDEEEDEEWDDYHGRYGSDYDDEDEDYY